MTGAAIRSSARRCRMPPPAETPNVLVVGFQLKVIGAHPIPHWIFQRCCLLTTPFWSGLPGFSVKLWMVDPVIETLSRHLRLARNRQRAALCRCAGARAATALHAGFGLVPPASDRMLEPYLAEHAAIRRLSTLRAESGDDRPAPTAGCCTLAGAVRRRSRRRHSGAGLFTTRSTAKSPQLLACRPNPASRRR